MYEARPSFLPSWHRVCYDASGAQYQLSPSRTVLAGLSRTGRGWRGKESRFATRYACAACLVSSCIQSDGPACVNVDVQQVPDAPQPSKATHFSGPSTCCRYDTRLDTRCRRYRSYCFSSRLGLQFRILDVCQTHYTCFSNETYEGRISVAFHRPNSLPTHHYHDTLVPSTLTETPRKPVNVQLYFAIRAEWPKQILSEPAVDLVALAKSANEVNDELEYVASNLMPTAVWISKHCYLSTALPPLANWH